MTQGTNTNPLGEASAPIKRIGGELQLRADKIAPRAGRQRAGADSRKTLAL